MNPIINLSLVLFFFCTLYPIHSKKQEVFAEMFGFQQFDNNLVSFLLREFNDIWVEYKLHDGESSRKSTFFFIKESTNKIGCNYLHCIYQRDQKDNAQFDVNCSCRKRFYFLDRFQSLFSSFFILYKHQILTLNLHPPSMVPAISYGN